MSISASLSNALTGLTAAARAAESVSSNVANAMTDGYGRRSLDLSSATLGGSGSGVRVDGVRRHVDQAVLADRRLADAALSGNTVRADFFTRIETALGTPDDGGALTARIATLEAELITAASRPESESRLASVLRAAGAIAGKLGEVADTVQTTRLEADGQIARDVAAVNTALARVETLNRDIRSFQANGRDASGLLDQRQAEVDRIARIVPVREVPREGGQIALYTPGGAVLLDGRAAELGFTATGTITPDMTQGSGALSGLTINGRGVATGGAFSPIAGGSLAAQFAIRDELAVSAQAGLDALARDLVERFADPAADPSLAPGDAGLFTDSGSAFDPLDEVGLSLRLTLNAAVDPDQGGALWHLRDGIAAVTPGPVGNAAGLDALLQALTGPRAPASGAGAGVARSAAGQAADLLSLTGADRQAAAADEAFASARFDAVRTLELQGGVDTDQEMQQLLLVEQAYAANARVIQTVDDMLQRLLNI